MLTRAEFGLHLKGRIDAVSIVKHSEGTTLSGKKYSFYQQIATVTVGKSQYEVVYRADSDPKGELCPFELDDKVSLRVENPRVFNGKVSFDIQS